MSPRLSALDASFLSLETSTAHMHVGWVATFEAPAQGRLPGFTEIRDHIERRLAHAPRYRQKLLSVPLGLNAPEWTDDGGFSVDRHVYRTARPFEELVDEVLSMPLRRDRPLWEMWICESPEDRRFAIIGKSHHCMVDGLAAVELFSLLLDPTPEPRPCEPDGWRAAPEPGGERLLLRGVRDLLADQLDLLRWPLHVVSSPACAARDAAAGALRVSRALTHLLRVAPASVINERQSPRRRLAWARRPLGDLRTIKRTYGTTLNDVILASVAGGVRTYLIRRGERPIALKVMVPVSVRSSSDVLGNQISFVFTELPCNEPDPLGRLYLVNDAMNQQKHERAPEGTRVVMQAAAHAPGAVQQTLSKIIASPRTSNLVVSNIPGPGGPLFMLGCALRGAYPVVPLADKHAVSVGMVSVDEQACFGVYADGDALPDVDTLARDIDDAISELLRAARLDETPRASQGLITRRPGVRQPSG